MRSLWDLVLEGLKRCAVRSYWTRMAAHAQQAVSAVAHGTKPEPASGKIGEHHRFLGDAKFGNLGPSHVTSLGSVVRSAVRIPVLPRFAYFTAFPAVVQP